MPRFVSCKNSKGCFLITVVVRQEISGCITPSKYLSTFNNMLPCFCYKNVIQLTDLFELFILKLMSHDDLQWLSLLKIDSYTTVKDNYPNDNEYTSP